MEPILPLATHAGKFVLMTVHDYKIIESGYKNSREKEKKCYIVVECV